MKQKTTARQRREAEAQRRKDTFSPKPAIPPPKEVKPAPPKQTFHPEVFPDQPEEEATREFLAYLDRYGTAPAKDDIPQPARKKSAPSGSIPRLNLEEGMPLVEEAIQRLHMGLQEMKVSRVKAVKLIHGYGSTGRGGKICTGVRQELAAMKRKKLIKDYIPGEDFGPTDEATRKLVEQDKTTNRDPDYGRINHGITIVVL